MPSGEVKVLLVDNHVMMRQGLRQLIAAKPNMTVVGEVFTGEPVTEPVRTAEPDLVVMNLDRTREEIGTASMRRLLEEFPQVKIIALSTNSELEFVLRALHAGVSGYVFTEHGSDELFRAIHIVMNSGLYLSPEISSALVRHFMRSYMGG